MLQMLQSTAGEKTLSSTIRTISAVEGDKTSLNALKMIIYSRSYAWLIDILQELFVNRSENLSGVAKIDRKLETGKSHYIQRRGSRHL